MDLEKLTERARGFLEGYAFARDGVGSPETFLQRLARPLREHRLTGVQHRLVEERDHGVERIPDVTLRVSGLPCLLIRRGNELFDVGAEAVRVGGPLAVRAQAHGRGEQFLHDEREARARALALAVVVSLMTRHAPEKDIIQTRDMDYRTSGAFNVGALAVLAILAALYTLFW